MLLFEPPTRDCHFFSSVPNSSLPNFRNHKCPQNCSRRLRSPHFAYPRGKKDIINNFRIRNYAHIQVLASPIRSPSLSLSSPYFSLLLISFSSYLPSLLNRLLKVNLILSKFRRRRNAPNSPRTQITNPRVSRPHPSHSPHLTHTYAR